MAISFVETDQELIQLCSQLEHSQWLAVDTEFHREKTYYPQLCLIQLANDDIIACVDPIKISDLSPLLDLFYRPDMTLVFHAARQDLELFYMLKGTLPENIFDTQLAATVLGYGDQIGYGNLVKHCLDVDLDKAHARTDWRQRPLSQAQIDYAADDVRYLRALYHLMSERLDSTGRRHWLNEDFASLSAVETYAPDPDNSWRKVKGAGKLKGLQLAILKNVSAWREQKAIAQNLPKKWILKDEVMIDIARFAPLSSEGMAKIRGFEQRDIDRHGTALIDAITAAKQLPAELWPVLSKPRPLSNQEEALVDALMSLLRKICDDQSITPIAVASRKEIESLVRGEDVAIKHGWRKQIVGQQLLDFLNGQISVKADSNKLIIQ